MNEAAHPRKFGNAYNNPTQYPTGGGSGWFDDVAAKLYQPPVKTTMDLPNALLHRAWGQAACKLEGFTYAPSDTVYWQHGHSTEHDFIYVTTQHLNAGQLAQLSDEVGPERTLLVLCAAFRVSKSGTERYPNLTVKKIPKAVLAGCEWGHDDYSLKVENLPKAPPPKGQMNFELTAEDAEHAKKG